MALSVRSENILQEYLGDVSWLRHSFSRSLSDANRSKHIMKYRTKEETGSGCGLLQSQNLAFKSKDNQLRKH
jgi:hypothetical protein